MENKNAIKSLLIKAVEEDLKRKAKTTLPFFMDCNVKVKDIEVNEKMVPVAKKTQHFTYCKN